LLLFNAGLATQTAGFRDPRGNPSLAAEDIGLSGLAGRYALALLELADEQKQLDRVADDLRGLKAVIAESEDLRRLIRSPLFTRTQQSQAMAAILDRAGVGELTRRCVLLVARNRRLFALDGMIAAYLAELARRRGEITAQVTSATALDDEQHRALVETLRNEVGAKVQVEVKVDPGLIGGLIVRVGSRMIDDSLRSKLQRLQLAMKGTG
jgi:F-type H+-transporting ATPase subunit delta